MSGGEGAQTPGAGPISDDAPTTRPGPAGTLGASQRPRPVDRTTDLPPLPPLPAGWEQVPPTGTGHAAPEPTPEQVDVWQARIAQYEKEAKATTDKAASAALFLEVGRIWEEQLGKQRNAARCYERAFHLAPSDGAVLHAARRLFTEVDNPAMTAKIMEAEVEASRDAEQKGALLAEKAVLLEQRLGNAEEAQRVFGQALDVWAAEPLAIHSLEQLHLSRGEHEALYRVYQSALSVAQGEERRLPLLIAASQLAEDHLDDVPAAIAHYEAVLALAPRHVFALAALRRLYAVAGRWEDLVRVLSASAEAADSAESATAHLMAAAKVELDRLRAPERALVSMLRALERSPKDLVLLRDIEWLYAANDRFQDVAKVLRRELEVTEDPAEVGPISHRLGVVLEERLGRAEEAIPAYARAVELSPGHVPARQALGRLYQRFERWTDLAALFESELETETVPDRRATIGYKLAELLEQRLDRRADAIDRLWAVLEAVPGHAPSLRALERALLQAERPADLVRLYEHELALAADPDQQAFLLERIGRLQEETLDDLGKATEAYRRLVALSPRHLVGLRALARLAERREDWAELRRVLELELEATNDQNEVVRLLHRVGQLQEQRLADEAGAILSYERVLSLAPAFLPALRSLGPLYAAAGRHADLVAMHQREVEATPEPAQAVPLLYRIAEIQLERLKDEAGAVRVYEQILARQPDALPAMSALAQIFARQGAYEPLVDVLSRQAAVVDDPVRKANLLKSLAEICEHELARPDRAAEVYQEILRLGVHQGAAVEALVRIFSAAGLWSALAVALRSAAEVTAEPRARAAVLLHTAEVYAERLDKRDAAVELLEEALRLLPDDPTTLAQLERLYVARKEWGRAVAIAERLSEHENDPKAYAARQVRIALMLEGTLTPPQSGAAHFRRALERMPNHPVALRGLELAHRRSGDWSGLVALYEREAAIHGEPHREAVLRFRAGDICEHRLGDLDGAKARYRAALALDPGFVPALEALRALAERTGDTDTALEAVGQLSSRVADPDRAAQLLFEAGALQLEGKSDTAAAERAFRNLLERVPDHAGASAQLEALLRAREDWAGVTEVMVARAEHAETPDAQAELLLASAHVAQDKLEDAARAAELYRQVLDRKPNDLTALTRLGPLLVQLERPDQALEVFHGVVGTAHDPATLASAFRALGVLYQEHKDDLVKAVQSFQAAFQADPRDAESLERLADVYRGAEDWHSAVNVMLRLVDVKTSTPGRVATLLDLAGVYRGPLDDVDSAVRALTTARELEPTNLQANLQLIELYERIGRWSKVAEVGTAFLEALPADRKADAVPLHLRLARVFETELGDDARATQELRQALAIEPTHPAALEALARLYGKAEATYPQAVDVHRRLLRLDPFRVESYHAIRAMFSARGEHDKAFVACEILGILRAQTSDEHLFYAERRDEVALAASGPLSEDDHARLLVHPDERGPVRSLLEILAGELGKTHPADLGPYDLNARNDRQGPRSDLIVKRLADELGEVLLPPPFEVWITRAEPLGVFAESAEPLALIIGADLERRYRETEKRFLIARQLERLRGGHHLLEAVGADELGKLLVATCKLANPSTPGGDAPEIAELSRKIGKLLSRKARKALDDLGGRATGLVFDRERHRTAAAHTANRAGLALTHDLEVAVRAIAREQGIKSVFADAAGAAETIGKSAEIRELLAFAISEEYFSLRAKLGFAIQA
jgi:tetratricopeptide (TPR) repeat protein